jgi:hypothetical protein
MKKTLIAVLVAVLLLATAGQAQAFHRGGFVNVNVGNVHVGVGGGHFGYYHGFGVNYGVGSVGVYLDPGIPVSYNSFVAPVQYSTYNTVSYYPVAAQALPAVAAPAPVDPCAQRAALYQWVPVPPVAAAPAAVQYQQVAQPVSDPAPATILYGAPVQTYQQVFNTLYPSAVYRTGFVGYSNTGLSSLGIARFNTGYHTGSFVTERRVDIRRGPFGGVHERAVIRTTHR